MAVEQYQSKIKQYARQIEMLMGQKNVEKIRWEEIIKKNNQQHQDSARLLE